MTPNEYNEMNELQDILDNLHSGPVLYDGVSVTLSSKRWGLTWIPQYELTDLVVRFINLKTKARVTEYYG